MSRNLSQQLMPLLYSRSMGTVGGIDKGDYAFFLERAAEGLLARAGKRTLRVHRVQYALRTLASARVVLLASYCVESQNKDLLIQLMCTRMILNLNPATAAETMRLFSDIKWSRLVAGILGQTESPSFCTHNSPVIAQKCRAGARLPWIMVWWQP